MGRLVIADKSPINYLLLIGHVDIPPALFEKVMVPVAVWEELEHPKAPPKLKNWAIITWLNALAYLLFHGLRSSVIRW